MTLPNEKHERFAQLLHEGVNVIDAHVQAGYAKGPSNAARLSLDPRIKRRLRELAGLDSDDPDANDSVTKPVAARKGAVALKLDMAEQVGQRGISKEAVVGLQWQILEAAMKAGQTNAANQALKQLAQLQGYWVEKSEAKQIIEKAEYDPAKVARAMLEIIERNVVDVTPLPKPETTS